jgi:hypothetical protein
MSGVDITALKSNLAMTRIQQPGVDLAGRRQSNRGTVSIRVRNVASTKLEFELATTVI